MITRKQYPSRERTLKSFPVNKETRWESGFSNSPFCSGNSCERKTSREARNFFFSCFVLNQLTVGIMSTTTTAEGFAHRDLILSLASRRLFFSSRDNVHCGDDQTRRSCPARYVAILCTYPPPVSRSLSFKRMRSTKTLLFYNCRITITSICVKHWWFNFLLHSSGTEGGSSCLREANLSLKS